MDRDHSFSPSEAEDVLKEYVCAVCSHDLEIVEIPGEFFRIVICPIHGDITVVGRVTRATVSIEHEREFTQFHTAVANLADLFPDLQDLGMDRNAALSMQRSHVCAVCGGLLDVAATDKTFTSYELNCRRHRGGGTIPKNKFVYNFQAMKTWERENKSKG